MKLEEDQALWELLGQARPPAVSPFFARNVLRKIREERRWTQRLWKRMHFRGWAIPVSGIAVVVLALGLFAHAPRSLNLGPSRTDDATVSLAAQDYEVVVNLDELLASEEDNLWTDSTSL